MNTVNCFGAVFCSFVIVQIWFSLHVNKVLVPCQLFQLVLDLSLLEMPYIARMYAMIL